MTHAEMTELRNLEKILNTTPCGSKAWDKAYDRYLELQAKQDEEYRANNIEKLRDFYDKHIANREWSEIDPEAWDWYSDYHKDVFGYRPRTLEFAG